MSTKFTTPVGRIVWGNPLEARPKKKNGQPVMKEGVQVVEYAFGLAIQKADFGAVWPNFEAEARAACPQGIPADFSYKFKDGDTGVDGQGRPLRDKPGQAGCMIISCTTEYPIPCFQRGQNGQFAQISQGIKTGDFIRVELSLQGHGRDPKVQGSKPGLYTNPNQVELVGYGEEIRGSADPNAAFGAPVTLPQGASTTPVASHPPMASAPAPQPQAPVQPNTNFPFAQPQQAPAATPAPAAPGKMPWET